MRYKHVFPRRTLLRGAGGIAIALPVLEEMNGRSVWAQPAAPPVRVVTFFFGLGVRPEHAALGLTGALAPLAPFASKIGYSRNLDLGTSDSSGNHDVGSAQAFRGVGNSGASLDQFVLDTLFGQTSPTAIKTLLAGTFSRNNGNRENHSYRSNGGVTDSIHRSPQALFDRVFGAFDPGAPPAPPGDKAPPGAEVCPSDKQRHLRRSILDSVLSQYKFLSSDAGNLGAASRAQLADHMDKVRELELTTFGARMQASVMQVETALAQSCAKPTRPPAFGGDNFDKIQMRVGDGDVSGSEPVPLDWEGWDRLWKALADIYAMALICDRTRFGNLQFTSGGERLSVRGNYSWGGRTISFNDPTTAHEYWHGWGDDRSFGASHKSRQWVENHTHLMMSRAAHFMARLDEVKEANGKSLLENTLFLMGTELGSGADSHSLRGIFHLWTSAAGRLKVGAPVDFGGMNATKAYNTIAEALTGKTMSAREAPDTQSKSLLRG